ncbi:DUF494 family protein [bacterium]|nr:DUF494 family protein [bacterium]
MTPARAAAVKNTSIVTVGKPVMREENTEAPQRVVGLVMHLLREIQEQRLDLEDVELISDDLLGQGYTESEINAAFSWVYAKIEGMPQVDILYQSPASNSSFRVLHPAESAVVRPDGYGQLLEMVTLGMLTMDDLERLIERAMAMGGIYGREDVRFLVHQYLFEDATRVQPNGTLHMVQPSNTVH